MNGTEKRHETDGQHPLSSWLNEEAKLSVPRYGMVLAACAAVALVLVALD